MRDRIRDTRETDEGRRHDLHRDAFLKSQGFTALRLESAQALEGPDHVFLTVEKYATPLLKEELM